MVVKYSYFMFNSKFNLEILVQREVTSVGRDTPRSDNLRASEESRESLVSVQNLQRSPKVEVSVGCL